LQPPDRETGGSPGGKTSGDRGGRGVVGAGVFGAEVAGDVVGGDYEEGSEYLGEDGFDRGVEGEPDAGPGMSREAGVPARGRLLLPRESRKG
jgi:hypothetical protein